MKFRDVGVISASGTIFVRLDVIADMYSKAEKSEELDKQFEELLNKCGYTLS